MTGLLQNAPMSSTRDYAVSPLFRRLGFIPSVFILFVSFALTAGSMSAQKLTLTQCVSRALEHNPRIHQAKARIAVTRGLRLQAVSPPPLSVGYYEEDISDSQGIGEGGQRIYSVSQEFDIPALIGARGYLYGSLTEAADIQYQYTQRNVRAAAIRAYTDASIASRKSELANTLVSLAARTAEAAKKRYESGATAKLEYLQAKSRLALAKQNMRRAVQQRTESELRLAAVMGDTTGAVFEPADTLTATIPIDLAEFNIDGAVVRHPLTAMAQAEMEGYRKDRDWRWLEYLPSFSAGAFRQQYRDMGSFWGVDFSAHIPIWLFLSPRGSHEEAAGRAMQAEANYTAAKARARLLVSSAYEQLAAATKNLADFTATFMDEAGELRRSASRSYAEGEISYIEYVSAVEDADKIQWEYYNALQTYMKAAADFQAETGIAIEW